MQLPLHDMRPLRSARSAFPGGLAPLALAAALMVGIAAPLAQAADAGGWIPTWAASPQPVWDADFFAPVGIPRALRDQTIRQVARVSLGGSQVRVEFSNEYGDRPLVIGAAHVALAGEGAAIAAGSDRALTFGGHPSVTVPPGRAHRQRPGRAHRAGARQRGRQPVPARDHADHDLAQ